MSTERLCQQYFKASRDTEVVFVETQSLTSTKMCQGVLSAAQISLRICAIFILTFLFLVLSLGFSIQCDSFSFPQDVIVLSLSLSI